MLINVNQSDYVPYITSEAGIRLSIHEHGSKPVLENNGFSVATGFRTDVSLVQVRFIISTVTEGNNKNNSVLQYISTISLHPTYERRLGSTVLVYKYLTRIKKY